MSLNTPDNREIPDETILDPDSIQQLKDLDESGNNTLLHELCDTFLSDAEERMDQIRQASAVMDIKKISNTAHALKGGASNFGAKRFTSLCQTIQQTGAETPPAQISSILSTLEEEYALLKTALLQLKE